MIYYEIAVPDRNDATMRVNLDGVYYYLRTTWVEYGKFWALSILDADMNLLIGMGRLSPGTIWNYFYSSFIGPPGVIGVLTDSENIGRNDFVNGIARLVYIPADQIGV